MKKAHVRILQGIQDSIPKELLDGLMKKVLAYPALKEIATRGKDDPNVSEEDRNKFRIMLDSGYLDKEIEVIDPEVEKKINDFVEAEITKAKKLGRLPKRAPKLKLNKKAKKNVRQKSTKGGSH